VTKEQLSPKAQTTPAADNLLRDAVALHAACGSRNPDEQTAVLANLTADALRQLLQQAPISDRSQRVVIGRYLDDTPDDLLAQAETALSQHLLLPSHIQVTRSKNMAKLRRWPLLTQFLQVIIHPPPIFNHG
jgi:hypothetical protein